MCIDGCSVRFLQIKDIQIGARWPHPQIWLISAPMDDSPVYLFISLCGFDYLWFSAKPGCGSFGPVHASGSLTGPCCVHVCPALLGSAKRSSTAGKSQLTGWRGWSGATWENVRCARNLPSALRGGPLSQNDPSEPMVTSFRPECFFKGNRLKTSPAVPACQREREQRRLLLQKGRESAGHWFPSNSNYCLFA